MFALPYSGLVPGAGHCEELLHAVDLHLDAGRGVLPPAPPNKHLEGQKVAGREPNYLCLQGDR